jgi:ABC-type branched-subunit amino acid transport system substrate-binding protein
VGGRGRGTLAGGASLLVALALVAGCGGSDKESGGDLVVAVNAPFSRTPALGRTIARGARLAADQVNAAGGIVIGTPSTG